MRLRRAAAAIAIAFVASACGGESASPSLTARSPTATPAPATVTYRVTGHVPRATVTFGPRDDRRRHTVELPWHEAVSAKAGATLDLLAVEPPSSVGHRLVCTITVELTGQRAETAVDSSHIIGTIGQGGPAVYDGTCNTEATVPSTRT